MVLPYLKGFYNKVVVFLYCSSISFVVLLYLAIWFLTSGIRALSLGRHCGKIFFIFADFFFWSRKKEGCDILEVFGTFICTICRKVSYI
jgi:hypothetical protein